MTATPSGMTYADYLKLQELLGLQQPLSTLHDEMLFIVIHQTKELWMKQMLHEVALAMELIAADQFAPAYKALSRVSRIQSVMTLSWDVLATLTPVDYSKFRDVLGTSSGFQSAQFRELEYRLGIRDPRFLDYYEGGTEGHDRLKAALEEPSLWEVADAARQRAGAESWLEVYREADRWFELYQLAEKLVDVDDALAGWRHKHVVTVERIIGGKTGTGGSSGVRYLESNLSKRAFPLLWSLRTEL